MDLTTADPNAREQVEISVFPKESTADIAALVRASDGIVLEETPRTVVAIGSLTPARGRPPASQSVGDHHPELPGPLAGGGPRSRGQLPTLPGQGRIEEGHVVFEHVAHRELFALEPPVRTVEGVLSSLTVCLIGDGSSPVAERGPCHG